MWSRSKRFPRRALGALAVAGLLAVPGARAELLDPSMPRTIVVGAPPGAAPSERLDPQRSGRARSRLPAQPVEVWRRHVSGGVELPPLVDGEGNVYVCLTIPEVIKLGPDSKEIWRVRTGNAAAVAPPTFTSDGTLVVVTKAGLAWGITPAGAVRFSAPLGINGRDADVPPLALSTGGVVIAAGSVVTEIDADGVVRARSLLDDRPPGSTAALDRASGALVETADGTLVTADNGAVYRVRPPSSARRLGSFGGSVRRGAALADERTLVAVVDSRRVVALDLPTGVARARSGASPGLFDAPAALGASGLVLVAMQTGMLLGLDTAGNERLRIPLDKSALSSPGTLGAAAGFFVQTELKPSPPVVVDAGGRIAFVRATGRAGVVSPDGRLAVAAERVCTAPVAVVPAGEKRMLVACRDGGLWMYGE